MQKVWFMPAKAEEGEQALDDKVSKLFGEAEGFIEEDDFVSLKIHFGEKNNTGHVKPGYLKKLVEEIKGHKGKPFFTDTNTLYKGERSNSIDHLNQAYEHDFNPENLGCPVIIADGLLSKNYSQVEIPGEHFDRVNVANDILHSDALIGVSHMTGHPAACMGASVKNIGMGCASRSGKQQQHADVNPSVDWDQCQECGQCIEWCPVGAIEMIEGKGAKIDQEVCYGCAECVATCQFGAIQVSWGGTSKALQEKMAEYALGALQDKRDKSLFFNFLIHVTEGCDCYNTAQSRVIEDIGILMSKDPVALDEASADLMNERTDSQFLNELYAENDLDYKLQLEHAQSIGLGSREYDLIKL